MKKVFVLGNAGEKTREAVEKLINDKVTVFLDGFIREMDMTKKHPSLYQFSKDLKALSDADYLLIAKGNSEFEIQVARHFGIPIIYEFSNGIIKEI